MGTTARGEIVACHISRLDRLTAWSYYLLMSNGAGQVTNTGFRPEVRGFESHRLHSVHGQGRQVPSDAIGSSTDTIRDARSLSPSRRAASLTAKAKGHVVTPREGWFEVVSGSSSRRYMVTPQGTGAICTCDWARKSHRPMGGPVACSHVLAVYRFAAGVLGVGVSAWGSTVDAARQHRTVQAIGDGITLTIRRTA